MSGCNHEPSLCLAPHAPEDVKPAHNSRASFPDRINYSNTAGTGNFSLRDKVAMQRELGVSDPGREYAESTESDCLAARPPCLDLGPIGQFPDESPGGVHVLSPLDRPRKCQIAENAVHRRPLPFFRSCL